jgi:signal transduction histidine kinase
VRARSSRRRPYLAHATRVALVASLVIALVYIGVVVVFDIVVGQRLVVQVDRRLADRLGDASRNPAASGATNNSDNAHDVDDAAVYLWRVDSARPPIPLTPGAPTLPPADWSPSSRPVTVDIGQSLFRLDSERVVGQRLIVGQSLHEVTHVQSVLQQVEVIAGPPLLVAVFFGTLLVGLKASNPVEDARRRQLEFTADASHELRTPLSVIEAEVSLALQSDRSADEYRDTLGRVGKESRRLRSIVEDLLWLSRFDSEPPPPGTEPVDVLAIASACADRFGAVAHRGDIELVVRHQGTGRPLINAAPEWIDRVVAVLVDNACRYAGQGGQVLIAVTGDADRVSLAVEDSGPGVLPEERSQLFDRFHRASGVGTGAGLGLAIADSVVRVTGGRWRVGDAALGGARMEVSWHRSGGSGGDRSAPFDRLSIGHDPSRRDSSVPG